MLEVVFYQSNQDLLAKMQAESSPLVIAPSPDIADNLRSLAPQLEVVTISKWTADHLKKLGLTRLRKSELMIKLASLWRHYFPSEDGHLFFDSFELFTELRSFTLNLELLSEFFKELDEKTVKSILLFWTYLDQEKIIDEHLSYHKVTESAAHRSMQFVGFKHMSGIQIDMLKTLSQTQDITIYFPANVGKEVLTYDWINWLADEKLTAEYDEEILGETRIVVVPKGKANLLLKKFFEQNPNYDLLMAGTQISFVSFQEAQKEKSFFKTSEDLFAMEIDWLMSSLRQELKVKKLLVADELSLLLEKYKEDAVLKAEYRKFKVIDLAVSSLIAYSEFQKSIDAFGIDVLEMIVGLNAPRVSFLTLENKIERSYLDINDLNFRNETKPLLLLATTNVGGFRANEKILSENMTKALRSIGPIKRAGLDFLFHKYELLSVMMNKKTVLFIEEQVLETDLSWREILKRFEVNQYDLGMKYSIKKVHEYLAPKRKPGPFTVKKFSASKLQMFIDCPQKYYFTYIDKIDNRPEERASLAPDELGNLEHKIIAAYFESQFNVGDEINLDRHKAIVVRIFSEYVNASKLILNETAKARGYNEIMHYTWNGITFLLVLIKNKKAKSIKFEVPLATNPWNLTGAIDCLVESYDGRVSLIDFKRSMSSTGTKAETLEFKKIQLWVYLLTLKNQGLEIDSFGYLNLSDLADDKLFFDEDETQKILSTSMPAAQAIIEEAISNIQALIEFEAMPREGKVCHYCSVNLFCLRGGASEHFKHT